MGELCVSKLCVDKLCVSKLCVRELCRESCVESVTEEAGGGGADADGSAQPKIRTPHRDVGEKTCGHRAAK